MQFRTFARRFAFAAFLVCLAPPVAQAQAGGYQFYWRQVGGSWSTGPYPSQAPACLHGSPNAACNGQNFKGAYQSGQVTTFWLKGCQAPPIQIQCDVRDGAGRVLTGKVNPPAPSAPYRIFWRQVGGTWSTGPYPAQTPSCLHGNANAACNGQNFKGNYKSGQVTTFWRNGCNAPPIQIQCEVRDATGQIVRP